MPLMSALGGSQPAIPSAAPDLELPIHVLRGRPSRKWTAFAPDVLPAWIADMDFRGAEAIQQALSKLVDEQNYGYAWARSDTDLRAAFADRMRGRYGWEIDQARIQPLADLVQGMALCISAFSDAADGVIVQLPIYPPFLASIDGTGRRRVYNPLADAGGRFEVDINGLRSAAEGGARILMLCNPHNPAGRVFTRGELVAVAEIATAYDLVVVSDEIHAELLYPGQRHIPFSTLGPDAAARTITLTSATKSFNIAGLRLGVMYFGSDALLERFRSRILQRHLGAVNTAGLEATVAAWRGGDPWLARVLDLLEANRARVTAWAAKYAPRIKHYPPEGTYLAWIDCAGLGLTSTTAREFFLEDARVGLNPGGDFGPGFEQCVRLNFATSPAILTEILERMDSAIQHLG